MLSPGIFACRIPRFRKVVVSPRNNETARHIDGCFHPPQDQGVTLLWLRQIVAGHERVASIILEHVHAFLCRGFRSGSGVPRRSISSRNLVSLRIRLAQGASPLSGLTMTYSTFDNVFKRRSNLRPFKTMVFLPSLKAAMISPR